MADDDNFVAPDGIRRTVMSFRPDNHVLAGLSPSDRALLAPALRGVAVSSAGPQAPNLPLDHVYFPDEGMVSLLAITPEGEMIEVASAGRGGVIGVELGDGLLVPLGQVRGSTIALVRLQAILPESETLSRALDAGREILLLQMRQNLVCTGLHSSERRLARWLLEAADKLASEVIPATQEIVAQRLGVRRTTVTVIARKLQEIGAIRWGRARVEIVDRAWLSSAACTCHRTLRERLNGHRALDLGVPPTKPWSGYVGLAPQSPMLSSSARETTR